MYAIAAPHPYTNESQPSSSQKVTVTAMSSTKAIICRNIHVTVHLWWKGQGQKTCRLSYAVMHPWLFPVHNHQPKIVSAEHKGYGLGVVVATKLEMRMLDGFYHVQFQTPLGTGDGVVVMQGGSARGGDSAMFYRGTYSQSGVDISANIRVGRIAPGDSVLGVSSATLVLHGKARGDGTIDFVGTAPEASGVPLKARMVPIAD